MSKKIKKIYKFKKEKLFIGMIFGFPIYVEIEFMDKYQRGAIEFRIKNHFQEMNDALMEKVCGSDKLI